MGVVVFADEATAAAVIAEIDCTPRIEGGAGPVKLGVPLRGQDGRVAVSHHLCEAEADWLEAYTVGMGVEVRGQLPADWQWG